MRNEFETKTTGGWILFGLLFALVWGLLPVYPYLIQPTEGAVEYHSHLQSIISLLSLHFS
jgi:hypothetical protein